MDKKFIKFLEQLLINHAQKVTQFRDEIIVEVNVCELHIHLIQSIYCH